MLQEKRVIKMIRLMLNEIKSIYHTLPLIKQFIIREVNERYKGSYLGILWSFITPIIMLTIYTFVFSVVFNSKWGTTTETNKLEFAMVLFAGLIVFNIFAEVVSKAPSIILSNPNYVKKVVFPLEILPIVSLGASLFHAIISLGILVILLIFVGNFSWTIILFPIILLPFCLIILGISWFLASLGVYIKDIGQIISLVISGLMFLSPIFYSVTIIPKEFQFIYWLNPITYIVEDARRLIIWGQLPHWDWFGIGMLVGVVVASLGYIWFKKTRKGFADVI